MTAIERGDPMAGAHVVLPFVLSLMAFGVCHVPVSDAPVPPVTQLQAMSEKPFLDVREGDGAYAAVDYMTRLGVLEPSEKAPALNTGELLFEPEAKADRATAIMALERLDSLRGEGEAAPVYLTAGGYLAVSVSRAAQYLGYQYDLTLPPADGEESFTYTGSFTDVTAADSFASGVAWAEEAGLLGESPDGEFHPGEPLLRGELAVLLYRYAVLQGADTRCSGDLSAYWDADHVPEEMVTPLCWVVESGVFDPLVSAELHPGYAVTRAQLAQTLTALQAVCTREAEATAIKQAQHEAAQSKSRENHEAIHAKVEEIAKAYGTKGGVQVAVIENGRVTDSYAYGWADRKEVLTTNTETGEQTYAAAGQMTAQHKMRIASISKVAITMAAMSMAERGEVDLDASIGDYWGVTVQNRAYPNTPVSIRSILTHTSSIPLYGDGTSQRYSDVRSRLAGGDFAGTQPGNIASWGYNNYAFGVLGMTLELAGNKVMDDILDERFFDALGIDGAFAAGELKHPELLTNLVRHDGSIARSVEYQRTLKTDPTPGATGVFFAGGLVISAADMAKLTAVLAGDGAYEGQRLLTVRSVETMETPLGTPAGLPYEQCQNLRRQHDIYGRDSLYYHTGSAYGVYNLMSYDPETGDGVVVLTTGASAMTDRYGIYAVCGEISETVYEAIK